jgi:hypothetical protein
MIDASATPNPNRRTGQWLSQQRSGSAQHHKHNLRYGVPHMYTNTPMHTYTHVHKYTHRPRTPHAHTPQPRSPPHPTPLPYPCVDWAAPQHRGAPWRQSPCMGCPGAHRLPKHRSRAGHGSRCPGPHPAASPRTPPPASGASGPAGSSHIAWWCVAKSRERGGARVCVWGGVMHINRHRRASIHVSIETPHHTSVLPRWRTTGVGGNRSEGKREGGRGGEGHSTGHPVTSPHPPHAPSTDSAYAKHGRTSPGPRPHTRGCSGALTHATTHGSVVVTSTLSVVMA